MRKYITALFALASFGYFLSTFTGCGKELISPNPFTDSTIVAGSDSAGYRDGLGTDARFDHPFGLALDNAGNLYVADQGNSLIRKIDPAANVTTLAGMAGVLGLTNGADSLSSFNKPFSVAADVSGNIFVADAGNNVIRKIAADGTVSTFAGTGVAGADDGTTQATFNSPLGVAADQAGNVYVADYGNDLIRKITADGTVSTIAGKQGVSGMADGQDTTARFNLPESVAVDATGNIYVADNGNNAIRKITPTGLVSTLAGNGTAGKSEGSGKTASFNSPFGIAVDGGGNVYVADAGNNKIRKIIPDGTVSTFAGSGIKGAANGTGVNASFNTPAGLAVDALGNIYVSDENNNLIRKITPDGIVTVIAVIHRKSAFN